MAANDLLAIGCYEALDQLGLRCPEDVSVIGFNDMPFVDRLRPPLSTIRFAHHQMGIEAATLLLERIDAEGAPVKILYLAPELVVRGSTAPPAPMVALRPALRGTHRELAMHRTRLQSRAVTLSARGQHREARALWPAHKLRAHVLCDATGFKEIYNGLVMRD